MGGAVLCQEEAPARRLNQKSAVIGGIWSEWFLFRVFQVCLVALVTRKQHRTWRTSSNIVGDTVQLQIRLTLSYTSQDYWLPRYAINSNSLVSMVSQYKQLGHDVICPDKVAPRQTRAEMSADVTENIVKPRETSWNIGVSVRAIFIEILRGLCSLAIPFNDVTLSVTMQVNNAGLFGDTAEWGGVMSDY